MEEDAQEMLDEVDEADEEKEEKSEGLVKEAVLDLDREINRIRKERKSLNLEIKRIDEVIKNAEEVGKKVERLRYLRRIERLDAREAELTDRKKKLREKGESLDKRLGKVKGIKEKLSGVD